MNKEEYDQVSGILQHTIQTADMAEGLSAALGESIPKLTFLPVVLQTNAAQTILEVTSVLVCLSGPSAIEPPLTLDCDVRVRLLRVRDGCELYDARFSYYGSSHTLREWATSDGADLRKELGAACIHLSHHIAEQIFLVHNLPESPAQERVLPWPPQNRR